MASDGVTRRRRHWILGALGIVAVALFAWVILHPATKPPSGPRAVPVTVATAAVRDMPVSVTALGAAQAWTSVTIFAQVSGKLLRVNFREGSEVHKGDVLAEIDPAPYRAVLVQAEGALKRDQALLADARLDLARYRALKAQNAIATQQVDTQAALVLQDEGIVEADMGQVAAAAVNLSWCRIVSPIDGRVGVRLVDPGNLVSASGSVSSVPSTAAATNNSSSTGGSGSGIVIVNQIEPIAVTFTVPQGDFQQLMDVSNGFRVPLATTALSQETDAVLDKGDLSIADNRVDPATGTVELKARFPNAQHHLWPGQFVNVQLTLQTLRKVVVIPAGAVNRGPAGSFVYVVDAGKKAAMRPVTLSWTEGDMVVIGRGVKAGDTVVTDGQMTLKPGMPVRIMQAARPGAPPQAAAAGTAQARPPAP